MAKFATTILENSKRFDDPYSDVVIAENESHALIKALRRYYGNRKIVKFVPYNPTPGRALSGQAGYGYETAPAGSGALLAAATPMVRVTMTRL